MTSSSPLSSEDSIQCNIKYDTTESCKRKYNILKEAQKENKMKNINYRLEILKKLLTIWDKYESEVNKSNFLDLGLSETTSNISTFSIVRTEINHAINNLYNWVKPIKCDTPLLIGLASSYVVPEPFGITLIFSAWNCNFLTLIIPMVQAIAAGNLIIAKPASSSPETCKVCMKICSELPSDVIQCCAGKPEVYTQLLKMRYDLIIFTGSAEKGKLIAEAAAPNLTPCILELGGQNPVIVEKSANLTLAAYNIVFGRHAIYGQACIAPEYIMCDKDIYEKLIEELKKTYIKFYGENPLNSENLGKIINDNHLDRIYKLIKNPGRMAKTLYGNVEHYNKEKRFIPPMLFGFENLKEMGKSNLAKNEIFGPVLYISPYEKIEDAVNYINEREKPLSAYLFTSDNNIKKYVQENTSSGCLLFNDTIVHFSSPFLPFGGVGNSGMGAYHGKWGFQHMSHWKPIINQSNILIPVRYPPYTANIKKLLKTFLNYYNFGQKQILKLVLYAILAIVLLVVLLKYLFK